MGFNFAYVRIIVHDDRNPLGFNFICIKHKHGKFLGKFL